MRGWQTSPFTVGVGRRVTCRRPSGLTFPVALFPAKTERPSLFVEVASLQIEGSCRRRHLAAVVRERFLDDLALGLLDQNPHRHPRAVEPRGQRLPEPGQAVLDVLRAKYGVRSENDEAFNHVFELADVARPRVGGERRYRVVFEADV